MANTKQNGDEWDQLGLNESEDSFSFADLFLMAKSLLPWIVVSSIVCLISAWIYYKKQEPQYLIKAKILIKDESSAGLKNMDAFQSLGLTTGSSSVDNELQIITTYNILDKVVKDLALNVQVKKDQFFNSISNKTYDVPFEVKVLEYANNAFLNTSSYAYKIINNEEGLWIEVGDYTKKIDFKKAIVLPVGKILITNKNQKLEEETWQLTIRKPSLTVESYSKKIQLTTPGKNTSIITLEMQSPNPEKDKKVLDKLIDTYIQEGVKDNNSINDSTLLFINERLVQVTDELNDVEGSIQNFKQQNNISNISEQSSMLLDLTRENSQKIIDAEIQLNVVSYLEKHIKEKGVSGVIPSSLMIEDALLTGYINQYNTLILQREQLSRTATEDNPVVVNLNNNINALYKELIAAVASTKRTYASVLSQLKAESQKNLGRIRQVPAKEREFLDISRQQQIKQELYLFLLKKREETAIGKSSTLSNTRIIDNARIVEVPISPKRNIILLAGLLLGAFLPFGFVFARWQINFRLKTKQDIKTWTQIPIIGEIGHQSDAHLFEVKHNPRSMLAEQFRILRTNLLFYKKTHEATVVMVTSSIPGEGKTFVSLNLAATLAANPEYKVLVVGMDLRKPRLTKELSLKNNLGVSDHLVHQATMDEIVYPIPDFSNLFVMPSGSIPPDPSELLMSTTAANMFKEISKQYDFIVIDCPPSIVTDFQIIGKYSDLCLYLARVGYTEKRQLQMANELFLSNKLPKMNLVVNDFDPKNYGGYNNSYYQYGYYESNEQPNWWDRWKNSLNF